MEKYLIRYEFVLCACRFCVKNIILFLGFKRYTKHLYFHIDIVMSRLELRNCCPVNNK